MGWLSPSLGEKTLVQQTQAQRRCSQNKILEVRGRSQRRLNLRRRGTGYLRGWINGFLVFMVDGKILLEWIDSHIFLCIWGPKSRMVTEKIKNISSRGKGVRRWKMCVKGKSESETGSSEGMWVRKEDYVINLAEYLWSEGDNAGLSENITREAMWCLTIWVWEEWAGIGGEEYPGDLKIR